MNEKKQTMILLTTLFLMVSMLILYPVLKISLNPIYTIKMAKKRTKESSKIG